MARNIRRIGQCCGWLAAILLLTSVLTGYGITEYHTVSALTFGLLGKATSQKLHNYLHLPLLAVLVLHIGIALGIRLGHRFSRS